MGSTRNSEFRELILGNRQPRDINKLVGWLDYCYLRIRFDLRYMIWKEGDRDEDLNDVGME
jgi:hypothetical protein